MGQLLSLPLILFGVVAGGAETDIVWGIEDLFIGGLVPGFLLLGIVSAWGVREGLRSGAGRTQFHLREAGIALWQAKWEVLMPVVVLVAFLLVGRRGIDLSHMQTMAAQMGLDSVAIYLLGALYWCTVNSVLEEYVWRWFLFRKCEVLTGGLRAVVLAALLFTVHHFFALIVYFDWPIAALCCLGVFLGGAIWSWLYLRYRSIWPGYLSHAIVDVFIFALGFWIFFLA